ncbi:fibrous sheath-interacting protein 1 [Cololabis saira]|uniref:fibrous sheath-interacting protein 1 n=1 Tax=Cololabis saira TaxID=129043 RepID=UPI002AD48C02|nr:fibrous sheath-interacting protein 1 [Cololabis saira]
MEITRGPLDDTSRPSSSEQPGSRISSTFELDVLTSDADIYQTLSDQNITEVTEYESENFKLQKAFEEMRKLDERLYVEACKEKGIRRQGKELQAQLWRDFLLNKPDGHRECANEALNTNLFLGLEAHTGEEEPFSSVFETEVTDFEHVGDNQWLEDSYQEVGDNQLKGSWFESFQSKNTQKNFELVSGEVLLTDAQKVRLAELLREIDEEEESGTRGPGSKDTMRAGSVLTGHGYTPEPPDLEKLIEIDSKIHLLLPAEEYHLLQSSYTNISLYLGLGSKVGWKCDGDRQPGETVLQDIKERREQELRLQEIQQQLEILDCRQEMISESPPVTEEQLRSLLDECELTESWIQGREGNETSGDLEDDHLSF